MKQSDIFSIIIIATVGTLVAYFAVNSFLGDPNMKSENITTIDAITADVLEPDPELFNAAAINPTVEVYVGECEDIDRNGIISREELISCGKITEEENIEDADTDLLACPDGTLTDDLTKCLNVVQTEQTENQIPEEQ